MPSSKKPKQFLTVEGREVPVTNLDKVLYPESGFTKGQVIHYYIRAADCLLPHFHNRPVTLKRFPDGVEGEAFYEKDAPSFTPDWVRTFPVPRRTGGEDIRYILINDLPTLVWCANIASVELHPFLHRIPKIDTPTVLVFDLDPGEGADILTCCEVGTELRDLLSRMELQSFPKVSGSKGIQIYVPLNTAVTYEQTQPFARAIARFLAEAHPNCIVAEMAKSERTNKVFIDWSQNSDFKTTVGVYSLRAKRASPFASLPVSWDEIWSALRRGKSDALFFEPEPALQRLKQLGDLFAPVLKLEQSLPPSVEKVLAARTRDGGVSAFKPRQNTSRTELSNIAAAARNAPRASRQGSRKRFVVQKHAASHLHFDFRLEMHGVLKSWAVPKGVPYALHDRRLAMATEDHPLEYMDFEGTIPQGQYGGGTVMVWDIGTYELIEGNYHKGSLHLALRGKKLKGEWDLRKNREEKGNKWLLSKAGEAMKPPSKKKEQTSALTGRTLEQIAADKSVQWQSNRGPIAGLDLDTLPNADMNFIQPMLAKPTGKLPEGADWEYEIKIDGYRALAIRDQAALRLLSRRNNTLNERFPTLAAALDELDHGTILDGEIAALNREGYPSFQLLQHHRPRAGNLVYYAFDLIAYRGRDVRGLPLRQRRELLNDALRNTREPIRISRTLEASPERLIAAVSEQGLEGIIAKRASGAYESGERSGSWLKYRVNRGQELVVGGYRPGANGFDNLAVGYYDERGELIFIAKIKNGFTPEIKRQLTERFPNLQTEDCPFRNLPEPKSARRGEALTAEAMKKYRWLKPKLVVQVEFADWTDADHLRHSRFVALRDDKDPRSATKELMADRHT